MECNVLTAKIEKPEWLTTRITNMEQIEETTRLLKELSLHTVCDSAECPNMGECFGKKTATFMILGNTCTRGCRFCAVNKGLADPLDLDEPVRVGIACKEMGLKHVVVTSVTRDDLPDGGAEHFARTVYEIRKMNPNSTVELLIPDLNNNYDALKVIVQAKPDILNHNVETIPHLYKDIRPQAHYIRSLGLIQKVKKWDATIYTKSGIMVGLGENDQQIYEVMDDLRRVNCDILTIGQYLQPSTDHVEMKEYVHPDKFEHYKCVAEEKGFSYVASGPFVRSSYNADLGINQMHKKY